MSDYFLADDLSGALDAAAAFHHAGRRVTIALSPNEWQWSSANEVVGVTTESRNASPTAAARAVTEAIAHGKARGGRLVYKKIDSTLRGPVAAELEALQAAMPEARFLFSPANPHVGRTVRDGLLLVHGVPVSETEFSRDPVSPVRESSIRALLGHTAGPHVTIADAATEEDLAMAVARMDRAGGAWVAIGSGALARPVAMRDARQDLSESLPNPTPLSGPILFVCGSAHRLNREQAALLASHAKVPVHEVNSRDPSSAVGPAVASLRQHGAGVLLLEGERTESALALRAIVSAASAVINGANVARLFVTGGETAFALCGELQIAALTFRAEVEPGLSLSDARTPTRRMRWAVKPGGFGDERTWVRGMDALRRP